MILKDIDQFKQFLITCLNNAKIICDQKRASAETISDRFSFEKEHRKACVKAYEDAIFDIENMVWTKWHMELLQELKSG